MAGDDEEDTFGGPEDPTSALFSGGYSGLDYAGNNLLCDVKRPKEGGCLRETGHRMGKNKERYIGN